MRGTSLRLDCLKQVKKEEQRKMRKMQVRSKKRQHAHFFHTHKMARRRKAPEENPGASDRTAPQEAECRSMRCPSCRGAWTHHPCAPAVHVFVALVAKSPDVERASDLFSEIKKKKVGNQGDSGTAGSQSGRGTHAKGHGVTTLSPERSRPDGL